MKLRNIMMVLATVLFAIPVSAVSPATTSVTASKVQRAVSFPYVGSKDAPGCYIVSVTVTNLATMVKVAYHTSKGSVIDTKDIVLTDSQTGKKYKYKFGAGLTASDRVTYKGWQFVTWTFTKLNKKTMSVDLVETGGNGFKFYGIDLTQDGARPKMTQQMLIDGLNETMANDLFHFADEQHWGSSVEYMY